MMPNENTEITGKLGKPFPQKDWAPTMVVCDTCGAKFRVRPSKLAQAHHFCSRACQGRWRSAQRGEQAANWRGGTAVQRGGRVKLYRPDHHEANMRGYVWRHRIVAEEKIGRPLLPEEIVHHVDGDMTNDDPDNIVVIANQAEHARLHGRHKRRDLIERMFRASPNWQKRKAPA